LTSAIEEFGIKWLSHNGAVYRKNRRVFLAFSLFKIVAEMGILIAFSMIITALVSLTIIPALLTTIKP
jgi:hypothetical protein